MAVTANINSSVTVTETIETNAAGATSPRIRYAAFNRSRVLKSTSTPPATKSAVFVLTLTAGAATIDLTALTGTAGAAVDGTGLRVQQILIANLGANGMTFTPGAANGIDLFGAGSSLTVRPGGDVSMFFNDAGPDIAAGDRTIDVAGTGTETAQVTIVMG